METPNIHDSKIYEKAISALKAVFGENAEFREGQYEAIESTLINKRTLVVQRTGWGKSMVYFIASKLTCGLTIIISPLLALIDNQIEAAHKVGLNCAVLNSSVPDADKDIIINSLRNNEYDILFTTPETLYSPKLQEIIPDMQIGLFVIDECHCISDWGHDFRLEYGKLNRVISSLPENVAVLGTTATANNRVIRDLKTQFGEDVTVIRGPLTRESLNIEILKIESKAERYAWLKINLRILPGSGIIYCLTREDCEILAEYLNQNGLNVRSYHSGLSKDEVSEAESLFMNNEIKALVATIKLGMGYDKPDIGFIIHLQRPSSLVAYYQQIGRGGRTPGSEAYCYLMTGSEDNRIQEHFINNAFPEEDTERTIVNALENSDGMTINTLSRECNISRSALNKSIMFLYNQNVIRYDSDSRRYVRTVVPYVYQGEHYNEVKNSKYSELDIINLYTEEEGCLSKYVVNALNDYTAGECGKCSNCLGHGILDGIHNPTEEDIDEVREFFNTNYVVIIPRVKWPEVSNPFDENTKISKPNEQGIALSRYNDAGIGEMVAFDKYHSDIFRDELVEKAASFLRDKGIIEEYSVITNISSARNEKVKNFTRRLADKLDIEYRELLAVTGRTLQQKEMQTSFFQYKNACEKITTNGNPVLTGGVILVDDMVDSGWTLTVAGRLLRKAGAEKVYPFCLADSSNSEN